MKAPLSRGYEADEGRTGRINRMRGQGGLWRAWAEAMSSTGTE